MVDSSDSTNLPPDDIVVISTDGCVLERVSPAIARHALRNQHAWKVADNPVTIQLLNDLDACPRPPSSVLEREQQTADARARAVARAKPAPEVIRVEKRFMSNFNAQYNPAGAMFDVEDFFDKTDKRNGGDGIVWVKTTAPKGRQAILEFESANGRRIKVPPIKAGDPVCLSKYASFEVIRNSTDLTQSITDGSLKPMSHKDATAYFAKKANLLKTTPGALLKKSEEFARDALSARPLSEDQVDKSQRLSNEVGPSIEDAISPYLQNLLAQVDVRLKDNERLPVQELMGELLNLEDSLTLDEYDLIKAIGYYPTVKKWAREKHLEMAKAAGMLPTEDALSE